MPDRTHVIAGRCTTTYDDGDDTRERRGDVCVVCKPDDTVLVHDATGYQPVAWLTRAEGVAVDGDVVTAWDGDARLRVAVHERYGGGQYPTGAAGRPVGDCPACDGTLARTGSTVTCPDCEERYGLPADATVLDDPCPDCGLPRFEAERGDTFVVCLDRRCESFDERVAEAFDRAWDCPSCGDDLRVLRRGRLILGCASYPACQTSLSFPAGTVVEECPCGLPVFETASGRRCLDTDCERSPAASTPQGL